MELPFIQAALPWCHGVRLPPRSCLEWDPSVVGGQGSCAELFEAKGNFIPVHPCHSSPCDLSRAAGSFPSRETLAPGKPWGAKDSTCWNHRGAGLLCSGPSR